MPCARRCTIRRARGRQGGGRGAPKSWADDCSIAAISQGDELGYRLRPRRPFLARLPDEDRPALLRELDLRPRERDELRALLRADFLAPRLADLAPFRADRRALFLAPLRADFLLPRFDDRVDFLLGAAREVPVSRRLGKGSSKSKDDGDDAGEGDGGLSEGNGSIHPEPDQPISI
jgi:hypothetical protein